MDFELNFLDLDESAGDSNQPVPTLASELVPQVRYVSVFRIDGDPILPPLLTKEKYEQLKKFKEQAVRVERWMEERRRRKNLEQKNQSNLKQGEPDIRKEELRGEIAVEVEVENTDMRTAGECLSVNSTASMSQYSADMLPDCYLLLSSMMSPEQECKETIESSTQSANVGEYDQTIEEFLNRRMKNLTISETIIYNNNTDEVLTKKWISKTTETLEQPVKSSDSQDNSSVHTPTKQIPSICVKPPTPIGPRSFCDSLSLLEDVESAQLKQSTNAPKSPFEDDSSDESDSGDNSFTRLPHALKSRRKISNVTGKILEFEKKRHAARGGRVKALFIKPPTRSSSSYSLNEVKSTKTYTILKHILDTGDQPADGSLIRSSSFTLEGPSEALLDHIRRQGKTAELEAAAAQRQKCNRSHKLSASATRDTVESKAKRVQKVEVKARSQAARAAAKSAAHTARNSASNKLRSPYEPKSNAKAKVVCPPKSAAPINPPTPSTTGASKALRASKARSPLATQQQFNVCTTYSVKSPLPANVLAKIEAEHRQRFMELLAQQQEEQNRLQELFEAQQRALLEQLSLGISKVQIKNSTAVATALPPSTPPSMDDPTASDNSKHQGIPRRRLFSDETPTSAASVGNSTSTEESANKRSQQEQLLQHQRRAEAATVICAYARGFLTRRLFRTEQVQRIVQTIRDTLIFVLNLHMESIECPEEANTAANIKLKARLLQQLSSACRTLHLVFFQTSIKERLEIIARDRKRIKTKLQNTNIKRSPRIAA